MSNFLRNFVLNKAKPTFKFNYLAMAMVAGGAAAFSYSEF